METINNILYWFKTFFKTQYKLDFVTANTVIDYPYALYFKIFKLDSWTYITSFETENAAMSYIESSINPKDDSIKFTTIFISK